GALDQHADKDTRSGIDDRSPAVAEPATLVSGPVQLHPSVSDRACDPERAPHPASRFIASWKPEQLDSLGQPSGRRHLNGCRHPLGWRIAEREHGDVESI